MSDAAWSFSSTIAGALAALGGVFYVDWRGRQTAATQLRSRQTTAARAWRDDFFVAQQHLAAALRASAWVGDGSDPAPQLGTPEHLVVLAPALGGREWRKVTHARRLAHRLVFAAQRPDFDPAVVRDAFEQIERGRAELSAEALDPAWRYVPHPDLDVVRASAT